MGDKVLAAVINDAIDDLLKTGPAPSALAAWKEKLRSALDSAALSPEEGAAHSLRANEQFLSKVIEVKGLPVRSIQTTGAKGSAAKVSTTIGIGMGKDFGKVEPLVRQAYAQHQAHIRETAEPFRKQELEAALANFEKWALTVPMGGTKDKVYREDARDVRQELKSFPSWGQRFAYTVGRTFPAKVNELSAEVSGAIAAIWHTCTWQPEPDHQFYNGKVYLIRGSWAIEKGLLDKKGVTFTDNLPLPGTGECRCRYEHL